MLDSWALTHCVDVAAEAGGPSAEAPKGTVAPEVVAPVPLPPLAKEAMEGNEEDMDDDDEDMEETTYLLKVARSRSHLLATSLSDYTVRVYALHHRQEGNNICQQITQRLCCIKAHTGPVTDLIFPFADWPSLLMTASEDGSIKSWDLTDPSNPRCLSTLVCDGRRSAVWSISVSASGQLLAASSQHGVVIWKRAMPNDPRGGNTGSNHGQGNNVLLKWKKCLSLEESFCDEVTQVLFHPYCSGVGLKSGNEPLLLAACGEDGLVCLFDLNKGGDEDDNVLGVLNAESSIAQVGFFGANPQECDFLWCRTNDECFRVWNWREAFGSGDEEDVMMEEADNKSKEVYALHDARKWLTESLLQQPSPSSSSSSNSSSNNAKNRKVDYLIDCYWDSAKSELRLMGGSALGEVYLFQVAVQTGMGTVEFAREREKVQVKGFLPNGHSAVVRSIDHSHVSTYMTCGEDGKLCLWSPDSGGNSTTMHRHSHQQISHNHQARRAANKTSMSSRRFKPY